VRSLTLLIFAVRQRHRVVDNSPNTRVSDATAVTFFVKCFNPLKHLKIYHQIIIKCSLVILSEIFIQIGYCL